jgi:hypothetical protein
MMAFIPRDAIWYIAEEVLEITVEGATQNVVHVNYLLIRAESPEDAYEKALRLGAEHETMYLNENKKEVRISFRGLRDLTVIHEALEDGSELLYEEKVGISKEALDTFVKPKEGLSVFKPIEKSLGPDYASAEILREARKLASR